MNSLPLVSAVIPVYNGSNYLKEAIDSVLAQSYSNIEIIVIDDGSTDNTWEIIQSYGDKIHGIHKENGGVSSALNIGIKNMSGEWFAWLSHDDLWLPDNIEKQVSHIMQNPGKGIYYGGYSYINPKHEILYGNNGCWFPKGSDLRHMLRSGNYIHGITALINKECFQTVGNFNENLRCTQDYEFWFVTAQKYETSLLPLRLAITRIHPSQIGNIRRNHCAIEYNKTRKHLFSITNRFELFPELNDNNISAIKHLLIDVYSRVYFDYLYLCVSKNIPTMRGALFSLSKKILPKSFICKIVRKLDREETAKIITQ